MRLEHEGGDGVETDPQGALQIPGQQLARGRGLGDPRPFDREAPQTIQHEEELGIRRPLAPQRAVVVEDRHPARGNDEAGGAGGDGLLGEAQDGIAHVAVAPGWERPATFAHRPPVIAASIFCITWSMVKLAAFWRGGKSTKLRRKSATTLCAGTARKRWSMYQSQ